jgi:hypothetical protein
MTPQVGRRKHMDQCKKGEGVIPSLYAVSGDRACHSVGSGTIVESTEEESTTSSVTVMNL